MAFTIVFQNEPYEIADEDFLQEVKVEYRRIRAFITKTAEDACAGGKTFDAAVDPRNIAWRCQEALKLARSYISHFDWSEDHVAALKAARHDLIDYSDNADLAYGWRKDVAKQAIEYFDEILIRVLPGIRIL